ncbi:hypothetical protein F503_06046 [Ophiostoma piceae UAMH 11346]|uniref:Uncharacterized protein n=1 Tax=Ophiostoma piceae (strain UAMH 11346) TaxID=1262450 RepID=S3CFM2_OPHP1|nr:hypothetical protein F503_06046 [Ophiostoma piceae UAMH 11346]
MFSDSTTHSTSRTEGIRHAHPMSSRSINSELSLLERETLRRGCLTLESAAHEESFCVWHLVRFLSRNHIMDLEDDDNKSDPGTTSGSSSTQSATSINQTFMEAHGRAAVRGAQVTNSVWVVLAKLARVIVCGPDHIPVDQLEFRNPSYYKRLTELQASFDEEKANLDRYCAEQATADLFPDGYPSSRQLLEDIQKGADLCAQHLNTTLNLRGLHGVDTTVWQTCTKLLETTLDMSWDAGGFLDLVSWMIFGKGSRQTLPAQPLTRSASVPQRTSRAMPLVSRRRPSAPPPNLLSKATTTTQITTPGSPTSIGEQTYPIVLSPRRGSIASLQQNVMPRSKFKEALPSANSPPQTQPAPASLTATEHGDTLQELSTEAPPVPHKVVILPPDTLKTGEKSRLRYLFFRKKK